MLEIKNLTKSFGGLTAVSDLSFDLEDRKSTRLNSSHW